jgi:hypothetical protein
MDRHNPLLRSQEICTVVCSPAFRRQHWASDRLNPLIRGTVGRLKAGLQTIAIDFAVLLLYPSAP